MSEIIKTLQPTRDVIAMAKAMFRHAWTQRQAQAQDIIRSGKRQIAALDAEIETVLGRIMSTNTASVIGAYEKKLSDLEAEKVRFEDMMLHHRAPDGSFEEKLERLLTFLSNPCKIWENGHASLRRIVLKLVFTDRIAYHRNEGARTTNLSLPFKALGMFTHSNLGNGAVGGNIRHFS